MSKEVDGVATRDDVLTIGPVQDYTDSQDGEPLNKCVPKFELEDVRGFTINGEYEKTQLLRFRDISYRAIPTPEPEPEPDISNGVYDNSEALLLENTGNQGSFDLAENGNGVLRVRFKLRILGNNGLIYPNDGSGWYFPTRFESIDTYDGTYFSAWTEDIGVTLCVSALTNNTGQDEKSIRFMLNFVQDTNAIGVVRDAFGFEVKQVGIVRRSIARNQRIAYYEPGDTLSSVSYIRADGVNYARILCDVDYVTGKTGANMDTVISTTYGVYARPFVSAGQTNERFTMDQSNNKITAPYLGSTTSFAQSLQVFGLYVNNGQSTGIIGDPSAVTVTQEANLLRIRETTTRFDISYKNPPSEISYTGTTSPQVQEHNHGKVIRASDFSAVRDYTYEQRYTSGFLLSSGTVSNEYIPECNYMAINGSISSDIAEVVTNLEVNNPYLYVRTNSTDNNRNIDVIVGYHSTYEQALAAATGNHRFVQFARPSSWTINEVVSVGMVPGNRYNDDPQNGIYRFPSNQSDYPVGARMITAECASVTYTKQDGVTTSTRLIYIPNPGDPVYARVVFNALNTHFWVYPKTSEDTTSNTEMYYSMVDSVNLLNAYIFPREANETYNDISAIVSVVYAPLNGQGASASITVIHEQMTFVPFIRISPTATTLANNLSSSWTLTVSANVPWALDSQPSGSWLTVSKTNDNTIAYTASTYTVANTNTNRIGTIVARGTGEYSTVTGSAEISQPPDYCFLFTGGTSFDGQTAGTIYLVSSETSFTAVYASRIKTTGVDLDSSCLSMEGSYTSMGIEAITFPTDHNVIAAIPFTANSNSTYAERTAKIILTQPRTDGNPIRNRLELTVVQAQAEFIGSIVANPQSIVLASNTYTGGPITLTTNYDPTEITVTTDQPWLYATPANDSVTYTVTAYQDATPFNARTGIITISGARGSATAVTTVSVSQPPAYMFAATGNSNYNGLTSFTITLLSSDTSHQIVIASRVASSPVVISNTSSVVSVIDNNNMNLRVTSITSNSNGIGWYTLSMSLNANATDNVKVGEIVLTQPTSNNRIVLTIRQQQQQFVGFIDLLEHSRTLPSNTQTTGWVSVQTNLNTWSASADNATNAWITYVANPPAERLEWTASTYASATPTNNRSGTVTVYGSYSGNVVRDSITISQPPDYYFVFTGGTSFDGQTAVTLNVSSSQTSQYVMIVSRVGGTAVTIQNNSQYISYSTNNSLSASISDITGQSILGWQLIGISIGANNAYSTKTGTFTITQPRTDGNPDIKHLTINIIQEASEFIPSIQLSTNSIVLNTNNSSSGTVSVTTNYDNSELTVTSDSPSWLSGYMPSSYIVPWNAQTNTDAYSLTGRTGTITVTGNRNGATASASFTVSQQSDYLFVITGNTEYNGQNTINISLSSSDTSGEILFISRHGSDRVGISNNSSYVSVAGDSGLNLAVSSIVSMNDNIGQYRLTFTLSSNNTDNRRSGTITLTQPRSDGNTAQRKRMEVIVTQAQKLPTIALATHSITLNSNMATSGTVNVTTSSGIITWRATSSDASWLTCTANELFDNLTWTAATYSDATQTSRTGTITVTGEHAYGYATDSLTISQPPDYLFSFTGTSEQAPTAITFNAPSSSTGHNVMVVSRQGATPVPFTTSNITLGGHSASMGVQVDSIVAYAGGIGWYMVSLSYYANSTTSEKVATVTITQPRTDGGTEKQVVLTLRQARREMTPEEYIRIENSGQNSVRITNSHPTQDADVSYYYIKVSEISQQPRPYYQDYTRVPANGSVIRTLGTYQDTIVPINSDDDGLDPDGTHRPYVTLLL